MILNIRSIRISSFMGRHQGGYLREIQIYRTSPEQSQDSLIFEACSYHRKIGSLYKLTILKPNFDASLSSHRIPNYSRYTKRILTFTTSRQKISMERHSPQKIVRAQRI